MINTRVVILAAGMGKRMGGEMPKALVKIAGEPMLAHLLKHVRESGLDSRPIVVVAPDSKEIFVETLGDQCDYAVQDVPRGTGHALLAAKDCIGDAQRVVVLYGDHPFIPSDALGRLVALHDAQPEAIAMLTSEVPDFENAYDAFKGWGRVLRDEHGEVLAIREVKDASAIELLICEVNPAIYLFPTSWMWARLPQLSSQNASGELYLTDLITMAFSEGVQVVTERANALDVMGVNTPAELARAEEVFSKQKAL